MKRLFLLWPLLGLLFALWVSVPCVLSLVVRARRAEFIQTYLLAWWDLGKSIFSFWAGIFRFIFLLVGSILGLVDLALGGLWLLLLDLLLAPFRAVRYLGRNVAAPGLPWIATVLTVFWCLLESVIFTYVMTPLVKDTLDNLTGAALPETALRIPLFFFLFLLILGSYAVLSAWAEAIRNRKVSEIVRITVIELVAALVEVVFLYREFVDALVPWFAARSAANFEPGAGTILLVAMLAWAGVRGMTWFLFAAHGTPILMALIRGQGLRSPAEGEADKTQDYLASERGFYTRLKEDRNWLREEGEALLAAGVLPPLQILAAALNHLLLLVTGRVLFDIPFRTLAEAMEHRGAGKPTSGKDRAPVKVPGGSPEAAAPQP